MAAVRSAGLAALVAIAIGPVGPFGTIARAPDPLPPTGVSASRFSPLDAITTGNVARLAVAWTYTVDDVDPGAKTTIECTPLVIDGIAYLTSAKGKVIALDAATGRERWRFDPFLAGPRPQVAGGVNRGVAAWREPASLRLRLFHGTADGRLVQLDAATGRPVASFGRNGTVDLAETMAPAFAGRRIGMTSPPLTIADLVIAGVSVGEGPEPAAPGDVLAFDAATGSLRWRFHTVAQPGDPGHHTWEGDSWKGRGGANPWSGLSADPARGLVFAATGSAAFDFYGGDRLGDNLYANSVIALDAKTGRRVWHHQIVRHDLWDYDLPTPPLPVRVTRDGRAIDAVAQLTKTGFVYVFDRATGTPLFDIVDRPVPASDVPGERAATHQPMPVLPPPFIRQGIARDDVRATSAVARAAMAARADRLRFGPFFTPPSLAGTVALPGTRGGATWSGGSFDPRTGLLYVNANEVPNILTLVPRDGPGGPYGLKAYEQLLDQDGYPAIAPPWGTLSAIDLNAGRIAWQVPLGTHPELAARGMTGTGTENFGGTIVTAGGLVFIGATKDEKFRAFDAATGRIVWEHQLDAGGYATPTTYAIDGRQFVLIAAGGGGKPRTRSGDRFVAFAVK